VITEYIKRVDHVEQSYVRLIHGLDLMPNIDYYAMVNRLVKRTGLCKSSIFGWFRRERQIKVAHARMVAKELGIGAGFSTIIEPGDHNTFNIYIGRVTPRRIKG
jgi:hypothetical protein